MFVLHPRLAADTLHLGDLPLSAVLLSRDANYPWVILVPRRAEISELHRLSVPDRRALMEESCAVAEAMQREFNADKMNVASLGNVVPQLHLHHVARLVDDPAWPGPIWGAQPAAAYNPGQLGERAMQLRRAFDVMPGFTPAGEA